ncbi:MAG: gamma-glutamyltransferase [Bryobacteraceae bacterium]|nr:gamma-glutamyltransferase [Bryobacteraceae bacterium]MDW8378799.1 gamma-glutamyltransferase [Bryobacterales bacterium]
MSRTCKVLLLLLALVSGLAARHPVRERKAIVVAQEPHATEVGVDVLRAGGNAVDAAVAVAFALAVTYPVAGNLGGGGFLLYRSAQGETEFFDFRERAPAAASRDMYLDSSGNLTRESMIGWKAAAVPGTVHGLETAHKKYGSKPWASLLAPAIKLAYGFPVSYALAESLRFSAKLLDRFPESRRIFLRDGKYFEPGDKLVQPELARTLQRLARGGAKEFYEGETARKLAAEMKANGGLITQEDLRNYRTVMRRPLEGSYKGYQILTAPPPSSGGVGILQMMGMLEPSGYEKYGAGSAAAIHFVAETMRRYYADRSEHLADPDFHPVPLSALLNPQYLAKRRASIRPDRATPSDEVKAGDFHLPESAETTHFSIVDPAGNAVALTYTINGGYGNGVTVPGLGFLLNNEMDDFAAKPGVPNMFGLVQGEANAIQPYKRPLSSMTPTIVLKDGKLFMVVGAPGGSRIITGVLQVILNVIDFGMNVQEAIDAPRFHHQWRPDQLSLESGFSPDTIELLKQRGHQIRSIPNVALVEAIVVENGFLAGGSDRRAHGKAAGF